MKTSFKFILTQIFIFSCFPAYSQNFTNQQVNAIRSAEAYLEFMNFSKEGLIRQLSSSFEGYDVQDATIAVNSMSVDWNEQAVGSAMSYLEFSGFSCSALINQLSSSAGDRFTEEQASYGAHQAGAC